MDPKNAILLAKVVVFAVVTSIALPGQPSRLTVPGPGITFPVSLDYKRVPAWSGDALVMADGSLTEPNVFQVYSKAGIQILSTVFSIPGADHTYVMSWAYNGGVLALCGSSFTNNGSGAPFIAWTSGSTGSWKIFRTEPYTPSLITVSSDGTFWTVGLELNPRLSEKGVNRNAGVVRHFDQSGKTMGTYIARSSFANPVHLDNGHGFLTASTDRVGWLHYTEDGAGEYAEFSSEGELAHYPIPTLTDFQSPLQMNGLAMTDSLDVFVSMRDMHTSGSSLFCLNRSTKQWASIATPDGSFGHGVAMLWGASGSQLVFRLPGDSPSTIHFLAPVR